MKGGLTMFGSKGSLFSGFDGLGAFHKVPVTVLVQGQTPVGLRFVTPKGKFDVSRAAFSVFDVKDFRVEEVRDFNGVFMTYEESVSGILAVDVTSDKNKVKELVSWVQHLCKQEAKRPELARGMIMGTSLKLKSHW